jgi:dipeptidyl aminopeptidase/acylaminoacyl peptidase
MDGKDLTRLTFGEYTHNVRLSPKGSYFITTHSNISTPQKMAVCNNKGKVIRELGDSMDGWKGIGNQWWAQEGMIQLSVDHRGSGHFGKEGVALMYRDLGKWEINDYIECVKWLRTKPYVDEKKVCITGSSYGGYVTCMALTYGADYFTYGIAGSSPTDWRLYDTHYTERYMETLDENPEADTGGEGQRRCKIALRQHASSIATCWKSRFPRRSSRSCIR